MFKAGKCLTANLYYGRNQLRIDQLANLPSEPPLAELINSEPGQTLVLCDRPYLGHSKNINGESSECSNHESQQWHPQTQDRTLLSSADLKSLELDVSYI